MSLYQSPKLDRHLVSRKMREADWNGTPDGISNQSDYEGVVMAKSNTNTASVESKRCSSCGEVKALSDFPKRKESKDGHRGQCKSCRDWYTPNRDRAKARRKLDHQKNRERDNQRSRQYDRQHREAIAKRRRSEWVAYHEENKERRNEYSREYQKRNRHDLTKKIRHRKTVDPSFRLTCALRSRIRSAITRGYKAGSAVRDMGCTGKQAREHIESLFDDHMTWENHGTYWAIDHIFPLAHANLEDRTEFLAVVNWRNLQPLESRENERKGDTITPEAQELFDSLKEEFRESISAQEEGTS